MLGVTWLILPGWLFDFCDAARDYRNYAGATGAESVFGVNSPAALGASAIGMLLWAVTIWYTHKRVTSQDQHDLALSYSMALQVLIFPAHLYNFIFVIPLILITLKWVWKKLNTRVDSLTLVIMILLLLTLYFAFLYWLGIFSEGFDSTIGAYFSTIRRFLPGRVYYFSITAMLLGPLLLWAKVRERHMEKML